MEGPLVVAVLCLAAGIAFLTTLIPFLYWKTFWLEVRLLKEAEKLQKQIDTLDEALARLLETVGVTPPSE